MIQKNNKTRRGFAQLIERGLIQHIEEAIRRGTAEHLKRGERMTVAECEELRQAGTWIKENAASDESEEPVLASRLPECQQEDHLTTADEEGP